MSLLLLFRPQTLSEFAQVRRREARKVSFAYVARALPVKRHSAPILQ
jgi:hypothetical protein